MPPTASDQPAKKQSKWSPEEDALIIELRGSGMKWEDISKQLPGRSAISCRLHYQNYLERRSEWSEERKDKLAQLYERFKADMWAKVAEELAVPWRAAEAMHWQLGEQDMARRAGVTPFSLAAVNAEANAAGRRNSPSRSHLSQSQSHLQPQRHGSLPREMSAPPQTRNLYSRNQQPPPPPQHSHTHPQRTGGGPVMDSRRETRTPVAAAAAAPTHHGVPEQPEVAYVTVPTLAPIHTPGQPTNANYLPSIAELTTGVAPYGGQPGMAPGHGHGNAPGAYQGGYGPSGSGYPTPEPPRTKRPRTPQEAYTEASLRRRIA